MNPRMRVSSNLQRLRREQGLTQEALAYLAQVDRGYVGMVENCKYAVSVDKLEQFSNALNVDPIEFFRQPAD